MKLKDFPHDLAEDATREHIFSRFRAGKILAFAAGCLISQASVLLAGYARYTGLTNRKALK
jgi:hypothetical protein